MPDNIMKTRAVKIKLVAIILAFIFFITSCDLIKEDTANNTEIAKVTNEATPTYTLEPTTPPTPTATNTPESTPTPIANIEGVVYDSKEATVTINLFGEVVFPECYDYKILSATAVSFYSSIYEGVVTVDELTTFVQDKKLDIPISGFMLDSLPKFLSKEGMLAYFVANGDRFAKMIIDGEVEVPFNNYGKIEYSDELKAFAEAKFARFTPEAKEVSKEICLYHMDSMFSNMNGETRVDPLLTTENSSSLPYSYKNNTEESLYLFDNKISSAYKGIGVEFLLIAFCEENELTPENQEKFTKTWKEFQTIAYAMEKYKTNVEQESFSEVVDLVENNECSVATLRLVSLYYMGLPFPLKIKDGDGTIDLWNDGRVDYHGEENLNIFLANLKFSMFMSRVIARANFSSKSAFDETVEDIVKGFPGTQLDSNSNINLSSRFYKNNPSDLYNITIPFIYGSNFI
ncbi:MAG: hypothetical protein KAQ68_01880 [Clostridiales bacterium]|nr:hypothetical protein [Clostridiales bacterium]